MQAMFDGVSLAAEPDRLTGSYPAVWLELQVRRRRYLPAFGAAIPSVIEHAKAFPGMVRFGFDIDWAHARFQTFGAFDSEGSRQAYVNDGAHGAIYRRMRGRLGPVQASYGTIAAAQLPTTWADMSQTRFASN